MKIKIIILTLVFILAGSVVLGLTLINLTQQEAYDAAVENNMQFEIDELNLELKQIAYDKTLKAASYPALNNYYGQLTKYYNPFNSETTLTVEEAKSEKAYKQLEIDVVAAAISLENAAIGYDDADFALSAATQAYNDAVKDSETTSADQLSLKYNVESLKISLHQAQNNLDSAQYKLDELVGMEGAAVQLPVEYSDPYNISPDDAYESALIIDISIYQSKRNAEAAAIKFEIAERFYEDDEDTYIIALAGLKSADLSYAKALLTLQMSVYDDIDNLKNKFDSIALAKLNKTIKSNAYTAAKSQYKAGIVSAASLENSEDSYNTSVKQLDAKIHDYILSSMRFKLNYGYNY